MALADLKMGVGSVTACTVSVLLAAMKAEYVELTCATNERVLAASIRDTHVAPTFEFVQVIVTPIPENGRWVVWGDNLAHNLQTKANARARKPKIGMHE